nr:hypothetical protein Iba_chr01aCG17530 [Ipomoea batatas]
MNAPIEISSSFGCQDSSTTMVGRRASHQACLKSQASVADKGKAPTSALVASDPTLAYLRPPAPLAIGVSPLPPFRHKWLMSSFTVDLSR